MKQKKYSLATINKQIRPLGLTLVRDPSDCGFLFLGHYTDKLKEHQKYVPVDLVTELPLDSWLKEAEKVYNVIQEIKATERKEMNRELRLGV